MKKFLIVFVLIIISFAQRSVAEDKMTVLPSLMNNGFEEVEQGKPRYWTFLGPEDTLIWDSQIYKEGKHSIQIFLQKHSKDGVRLQQAVEVEAFTRYAAGGALKTDGLEDGSAQISVIFVDQNGNQITSIDLLTVSGTQDWTFKKVLVESPSGTDAVYIKCFVNGKGKAWFDDIHFTSKVSGGY